MIYNAARERIGVRSASSDPHFTPITEELIEAIQMPDQDRPPGAPGSTSVPNLVDQYRRQQEELRARATEIARLKTEVLRVAEVEAAEIVASARADIRRVIVDARRELLELATQIQTITSTHEELGPAQDSEFVHGESQPEALLLPAVDGLQTRDRLLEARHEIGRVLDEARDDLDHLKATGRVVQGSAEPIAAVVTAATTEDVMRLPQEPSIESAIQAVDVQHVEFPRLEAQDRDTTELALEEPGRSTTFVRAIAGTLVVIAVFVVVGTVWWMRGSQSRDVPGRGASSVSLPAAALPPAAPQLSSAAPATAPAAAGVIENAEKSPNVAVSTGPTVGRGGDERSSQTAESSQQKRLADSSSVAAPAVAPPSGSAPGVGRPAPGPKPTVVETTSDAAPELTAAAERWLDAYYHQDSARLTSVAARGMKISDQRTTVERPPPGGALRRSLERVNFQFVGETAILTARMTERTDATDQERQYVSWVSQAWIREAGQWRVMEVRIIGDTKLR